MTKIALMLLAGATVSTAALADNTAMSRDEVRATVSEMLADAETRSSLLQGGGMAGYDKGFIIGSADGNWKMKVNGLIQFRYIANIRDEDNIDTEDDDFSNGFQLRKARVVFSGNAINPNLTYVIAMETNNNQQGTGDTIDPDGTPDNGDEFQVNQGSGGWIANDVYFMYALDGGWSIRGGQYKVGYLKEELLSEKDTLAMERGIMNNLFNQGRSQGIGFVNESADWRWALDFSDGLNSANTEFTDPSEAEYCFTGRGTWKWAGDWTTLNDYTSRPNDPSAGAVGFAGTWQHGNEPTANNDSDYWGLTADVQWEGNGWNVFGAVVYTNLNQAVGSAVNHMGATLQGGYRWNETSEVYAKIDYIVLDDDDAGVDTDIDEDIGFITFGYNHYFAGNAAKLTVDCIFSLNETGNLTTADFGAANGASIGASNGLIGSDDSGEFALRAQFQLAF
jgi:hypothetical protein